MPRSSTRSEPLGGAIEDDAEVGADAGHDPAGVDRLELLRRHVLDEEPARADRLDAERAEDERQRERGGRVAVVDRDAETAAADRLDVEGVEDVLRVALADARGVRRLPHLGERRAAELLAAEVLLDLLLKAEVIWLPGHSKTRTWITSGSALERPTWTPACRPWVLSTCRVTAAGEMRRSATCTPVDVSPAMIARWIIRHASGEARLATTRSPRLRAVPSAAASRTTVSGVRSTLTSPVAPSRPNGRGRRPGLPDDALVDLRAGLDLLERVDADAREEARLGPDRHLVADRHALVHAHVVAEVAAAAEDRALDDRAPAEVRADVDHAPGRHARPRGRSRPARAPSTARSRRRRRSGSSRR